MSERAESHSVESFRTGQRKIRWALITAVASSGKVLISSKSQRRTVGKSWQYGGCRISSCEVTGCGENKRINRSRLGEIDVQPVQELYAW